MLYIIGLGLGNAKDITVNGLEAIRKADRVYLEAYTSMLTVGKEVLEQFYERTMILADRDMVEQEADTILNEADVKDIAFLVVGDPFGATTHTDLVLRAQKMGIKCKIIHNASIMNAVGCCGLQLYSFGETVSIPYWTETWQPDSYYEKISGNRSRGLHTLCLLDIRMKEPTLESLTKKKKEYELPRFMSASEAANQLLETVARKDDDVDKVYNKNTLCVGLARIGSETQKVIACTLGEMKTTDLGPPLHSLVITGHLHPLEAEYLAQFSTHHDGEELLKFCKNT